MREICAAVREGKPIIALQDPDVAHGGMTLEMVREQLLAADAKYAGWGFEGDDGPRGEQLIEALFAQPVIEWNRIGDFQDVTLRLIAERILGPDHPPVYVQGEKALLRPAISAPPPGNQVHRYC